MVEKKKDEGSSSTYLLKNIPTNIYRHFAGLCKMKGKTVKAVLIDFMKDYN
tara:strand:+ start:408 stop:560 length:153 start_codon:yes stop_codon:yes gene_type:complete